MGVLKVVSVWCDSLHDCGLIIWGFICLGTIALIFVVSILAFIGLNQIMGLFNIICETG